MRYNFNQTERQANTASHQHFRPKTYFDSITNRQTTPLFPLSKQKPETFEKTNLNLFKQKQNITQDTQPQMLNLIKIPSSNSQFPTLSDLNRLQFSPLSYPIGQLIKFSKMIIEASPQRKAIAKTFNLQRLIEIIAENYQITSYHNFTHAFSLLQALFQCYNRSKVLRESISQSEWFFVFVSALVHDMNHPGTNNGFQIKAKTKYAVQADNQSVLQKMHLNVFWSLLRKNSQVNFLHGYSRNQSIEICNLITRLIMATDVSKHFKGVEYVQTINKNKQKTTLKGEESLLILEQLFHACDISNPCLNYENYMNWSALVTYEFNEITLKEERLGLPVTGFLKFENMEKFYKGQVGFCNGFVLPLWKELGIIYPGLQEFVDNITGNVSKLQKKIQEMC